MKMLTQRRNGAEGGKIFSRSEPLGPGRLRSFQGAAAARPESAMLGASAPLREKSWSSILWPGGWVLALLLMLTGFNAQAEVAVKASLTRGVTVMDEPVQLQIKITNARRAGDPPEVAADGLGIRYLGPNTTSVMRIDGSGFRQERTTIHVYEISPTKNGTFTIPAVEVEVDGRKLKTEPVALTVQPSSAEDETKPRAQGTAELFVPRTTAYVGEMIPVELRLYVDARVRWQAVAMPTIAGEGFTKQKIPEPRRPEQVVKGGREYDVLVFKTAITPSKAGKISLGPGEIIYNAQVPRAKRSGARSLFDMFDDDVFGDPFFAQTQQIKVQSKPVELTVKPLPPGKPPGFSGAVGKFEFSGEGSPGQVKMGDPVTMKLRVSGQGNFDRVEAPVIEDANGWRSYPPSSAFTKDASDEVGVGGTKVFEMAVIPETRKTQMPVFAFSYFDPEAAKYVTLTSEPAPLKVEGGNVATPPPAPRPTKNAPDMPPPKADPPPASDIRGLRYDAGQRRSFQPLSERRGFWLAQTLPLAALLLLTALRLRRAPDGAAVHQTALRRERVALFGKLRGDGLGHAEFFDAAARVMQIDTALATGVEALTVDAAAARELAANDVEVAEVIDEVFEARAELLFAGGGRGEGAVSAESRSRVLSVLEKLGRKDAKS